MSGRPSASSAGPRKSGRPTPPWSPPSSSGGATRSRAFRSCLGLLRLAKCHGDARLEAAAERALAIGSYSYRSVESILKHRLDETAAEQAEAAGPVPHDNIRGALYYQ